MADVDDVREQLQHEAPGGATSRGPKYGGPGEIQADVPPYDDLRGPASAEGAEGVRKAFDADNAPDPDSSTPLPVSEEERAGMSGTEMNPEPALGVGESSGGRAEDLAPDRPDTGTKSGRPVGTVQGAESDAAGAHGD